MDAGAYGLILRRLAALERRLSAVIRTGVVVAVALEPYRVRVDVGPGDDGAPVTTDWLPVMVSRSGEVRAWSPLTVAERVLVLTPGGEDTAAFVVPALVSADFAAASPEAGAEVVRWDALGEPGTEVGRMEVTRGADASSSAIRLAVGLSVLELRGDGRWGLSNGTSSMRADLSDILVDAPHIGLND